VTCPYSLSTGVFTIHYATGGLLNLQTTLPQVSVKAGGTPGFYFCTVLFALVKKQLTSIHSFFHIHYFINYNFLTFFL
jgi:hypothetical protein